MIAGSPVSPRVDHVPAMRPNTAGWRKSILCVRGGGGLGKSSLCSVFTAAGIAYVSIDAAVMACDAGVPEIDAHRAAFGAEANYNLHLLYPRLAERGGEAFLDWFFRPYIVEQKSMNLSVDGYLLSFPRIYIDFIERCRRMDYRVWTVERTI